MHKITLLLLSLICFSCQPQQVEEQIITTSKSEQIEVVARDYFKTFAERQDWEKLLSFYSKDLQFEDALMQLHLDYDGFVDFYDWPNPSFKKLTPEQKHLVLEELVVNDSMAVGRGYLNPFYWEGKLFELEWHAGFTIWLYFDEAQKITRQIDWFEYDGNVLISIGNRLNKGEY